MSSAQSGGKPKSGDLRVTEAFNLGSEHLAWKLSIPRTVKRLTFGTGLFDQTDTVFDAVINESLEQIRPLPINSAVGYGNNGNSLSGQRYRNFTVFKGSGEQLYQNDTSNLRYFPVYYAA